MSQPQNHSAKHKVKKDNLSDWERLQKLTIKGGKKTDSVKLVREDRDKWL